MHKLGEHLRRDRDTVASREQFTEQSRCVGMMRMLDDLHGHEETRIRAMRHAGPSRISSYHSSRVPSGWRILPTLTGSMSRRLDSLRVPSRAAPCG